MSEKVFDIAQTKAIIGLGNPGDKYYRTRHSIGFRIVDALVDELGGNWQKKDDMELARVSINGYPVLVIKPQTFMNNSGKVCPFLLKKGIRPEEILVIHDELEKPFGKVHVRPEGSARGHNGLRSIIDMIGKEFWRLRFGIGRPEDKTDVSRYVLTLFLPEQEKTIDERIANAVDVIMGRSS